MLFCYFNPEDLQYYDFLVDNNIIFNLRFFIYQHEEKIKKAFKELLSKIKKNINSEKLITEMDYEHLLCVIDFTFCVMFSKAVVNLSERHKNDNYNYMLSILSAHNLAEKMSIDTQNPEYVEQLESIITHCCNSILDAYMEK